MSALNAAGIAEGLIWLSDLPNAPGPESGYAARLQVELREIGASRDELIDAARRLAKSQRFHPTPGQVAESIRVSRGPGRPSPTALPGPTGSAQKIPEAHADLRGFAHRMQQQYPDDGSAGWPPRWFREGLRELGIGTQTKRRGGSPRPLFDATNTNR